MKKKLCALLVCLTLLLAGCSENKEAPIDATPTPTVTPTPEPTPEPTPTPTPVPVVAIADYQYDVVSNTTLAVSFNYPTHWINAPAKSTICYVEPANPGELAARLAVASKVVAKKPTTEKLKEELDGFLQIITESSLDYMDGEEKEKVEIMGVNGIRRKYTARDIDTGIEYTGYALICYVKSAKRIYLLHFTAPSDKYDELSVVIDVIRESMKTA